MAKSIDMEQDQLLRLLTDALRAGPASPEWHQAVSMLRATDGSADEYRLLMTARENLERGKDYRAVRPGPGFTRKVMDGVEAESTRSGPNTANWIAIGGALALLGVIGLVAYFLASSAAPEKDSLNELSKAYIVSTRLNASFENGMPQGARVVGPLPLVTRQGLRPGPAGDAPQGAVLIPNEPIPATDTAALEVDLQVQRPVDETFFQIFLTDDAAFSEDRATSDHELTWVLSGKTASVMLPDRQSAAPQAGAPPAIDKPGVVKLKLRWNRNFAIIEQDGRRIWAGMHGLSSDKPRLAGIRFIRQPGDKADGVAVTQMRLLTP